MKKAKKIILIVICLAVLIFIGAKALRDNYADKHRGHGFDYMGGWSSTNFNGYRVTDGEKLAVLDHEPSFVIEDEKEMPVLDGAEACYPLYSAAAKAVYRNIGEIEKNYYSPQMKYNGKIVTFSNTVMGYERLIKGEVDLMFAARPSEEQKQDAAKAYEQICTVPIAKEAFVFFVRSDNPVNDISSEDIRKIYSGEIENWKELGGKDQKILAYQRPENSGSQVMMKYFMKDKPLKEPMTYEMVGGMGGVITEVAQYADEKGAMGYTFKYFLTGLQQEKNVKILSIDGIEPTAENIQNGTYPAVANVVMAYLKSNDNPNVQKMIDFMLSDDGQYLVEATGYAKLGTEAKVRIENELPETYEYVYEKGVFRRSTDSEVYDLVHEGTEWKGMMSYYGSYTDIEELKNRYSALLQSEGRYGELIMEEKGNRLIVTGYLDDSNRFVTEPPFDGLPETGTEFVYGG